MLLLSGSLHSVIAAVSFILEMVAAADRNVNFNGGEAPEDEV